MSKIIKLYLLRLLGFTIISIYFYIRFVKERLPRELYFLKIDVISGYYNISYDLLLIVITLSFIILSFVRLIFLLFIIYDKPLHFKEGFIKRNLIKLAIYLKDALIAFNAWLTQIIPDSYDKVITLAQNFYKYFGHKEKWLAIIFSVLPFLIISFIFLFEVLFYFQLNMFYKSLFLLIIPLVLQLWLYQIELLTSNMLEIEDNLIINHSFLEDGQDHFSFLKKETCTWNDNDFLFFTEEYLKLYSLQSFINYYKIIETKYKTRALFFMYFCYFVGWNYILFKNLYLYDC